MQRLLVVQLVVQLVVLVLLLMTAKFLVFVSQPLVGNTKHNVPNYFEFVKQIKWITLKPEETIISYDVVGLFTSIPPSSAIDVVQQALLEDITLSDQNNLSCNQICDLLHLCLYNTYFSYIGQPYQQCHGCRMGSPVFPLSQTCMWNNLNT